jgi:hypothetical protein
LTQTLRYRSEARAGKQPGFDNDLGAATVDYASDRPGSFAFQAKMFHVKHLCLLFVGKLFALARSSVYAIIVSALFGGAIAVANFPQSVNDALCLCASWCGADFVPPFSETCFGEAE